MNDKIVDSPGVPKGRPPPAGVFPKRLVRRRKPKEDHSTLAAVSHLLSHLMLNFLLCRCSFKAKLKAASSYDQLLKLSLQQSNRRVLRSTGYLVLQEIQLKHKVLRQGQTVLDVGAALGGWSQFASKTAQLLVSVDVRKIYPFQDKAHRVVTGDITQLQVQSKVVLAMGSKTEADVLLADLSPPFSAVVDLDSFALRNLNLEVLFFAEKALKPGGSLVLRYLQSIHSQEQLHALRGYFHQVSTHRYSQSRSQSPSEYFIGKGFKFNPEYVLRRRFIKLFTEHPEKRAQLIASHPQFRYFAKLITHSEARVLEGRGATDQEIIDIFNRMGYIRLFPGEWHWDGIPQQELQFYPRSIASKLQLLDKVKKGEIGGQKKEVKRGLLAQGEVYNIGKSKTKKQQFLQNIGKKIYRQEDLMDNPHTRQIAEGQVQNLRQNVKWFDEQLDRRQAKRKNPDLADSSPENRQNLYDEQVSRMEQTQRKAQLAKQTRQEKGRAKEERTRSKQIAEKTRRKLERQTVRRASRSAK